MSEKPLLLSPAKSGVLVARDQTYLRMAFLAAGLLVVLVGAADVASRISRAALGADALRLAFGPAVALQNRDVLAASASSAATTTAAITPVHIKIPTLGVDAPVVEVGTKADGSMGTPTKFGDVAWYAPGSKPGAPGNAVFAGHVNNALTTAGVFEHLASVSIGDYITVSDASGKTLVYRVKEKRQFSADQAPAAEVFATSGPSQLALITCEGAWLPSERSYDKRLVVIAVRL